MRLAILALGSMVSIPAGTYRPLYTTPDAPMVHVGAFRLDRTLVTRGDFQRFVVAHPEWQRGMVKPLFAERSYLADWRTATVAGDVADLARPVTSVSWFAARAYCAAQGKRLPTVDEWEYVAAASATRRNASANPEFRRHLLATIAARPHVLGPVGHSVPNAFGVQDLHDLVWEWTEDWNSVVVPDDSRTAGSSVDARDHHLYCASAAIGARDPSDYPAFARYAVRAGLTGRATVSSVGFRCAA